MSSLLSAELAATCCALGYYDSKSNKYYADENTLETVKDLIRYLRRDDDTHDIRRQLGDTKVLQTDLLPLLKGYWEETDLFDVLLRLLVNLTTPALMLWHEEIPTEKTARNHYLQIEEHLQSYKQAFAEEAVWAALSSRISKILEVDFAERGDENSLIIERILILIRNVLYVPADPDSEKRPDNDASVHDQVLWALHQSGILDIILYLSSSMREQAYYMHVLELLAYMLREQSASDLAQAALQRSQTEKLRGEAELLAIRHRENNQKQQKVKMYNGARHSRFGGTFVVQSMKSISDNELIYHKPLNKLDALDFDVHKRKPKTPKNRLPVKSEAAERRSAFSIRLFLKEFCIEFLNGAYNTLMYHVKGNLAQAKAQAHDESYYLWALRFFMEFNRCYKFEVKLVTETMSVQTFHFVQQQMENYFDMLSTDKKKLHLWSKRLHLALLAYRELLLTIFAMDKSPDGTVKDSARVIKSNIFYVLEYRELILTLLVTFDELKMSQAYLNDLIETQHIFLKMLQSYCGGDGEIIVQKKSKAKKKKKKPRTTAEPAVEMNLELQWDEIAPQLSTVLEGQTDVSTDVVPFDATSDVPIDDQKSEAMKNVQRKLRQNEFEAAIGLLRAAREVWPENDCFGSNSMAPEEEFLAFREIFFADLGENQPEKSGEQTRPEDEYEEDEEDEIANMQISESDLKFEDFTKRLAHPKVVRACGLALKNFEINSTLTNHCIIKLLHRIAFDCKMFVMVFQASIFRTFQKIYEFKDLPQFKELVKFSDYIVRQFVNIANTNSKIYIETLFWKSSKDAFDIEYGYGAYQEKSEAATKGWTELEEDELRRLFMEHQEKQIEEDVVDWIVSNLINNTRTRRNVLKKLKEMYLLTDYKGHRKSGIRSRIPKHWGEDEEAQLRELYEQFKDASDPLNCIMARLNVQRPKTRIIEKLLVMGLVQDRKELRKKRAKKTKTSSGFDGIDDDDNNSSESDSERRTNSSRNSTQGNRAVKDTRRETKKSRHAKGKTSIHVQVSVKDLTKLLIEIVDSGMSEALEWIRESFSDAADDFDSDLDTDDTGIPLVPILDSSVAAIENSQFTKLIKAFGLKEPSNEQEIYWRIPYHISQNSLQSYCDLITKALEGTLSIEEQATVDTQNNLDIQESSDDEDAFDKLRNMMNTNEDLQTSSNIEATSNSSSANVTNFHEVQKARKDRSENAEASVNQENNFPEKQQNKKLQKKKKVLYVSGSDSKSDHELDKENLHTDKDSKEDEKAESSGTQNSQKIRKIRRVIVTDSEDSDDAKVSGDGNKRNREPSGSDSEKPKVKRNRVLESDSEND